MNGVNTYFKRLPFLGTPLFLAYSTKVTEKVVVDLKDPLHFESWWSQLSLLARQELNFISQFFLLSGQSCRVIINPVTDFDTSSFIGSSRGRVHSTGIYALSPHADSVSFVCAPQITTGHLPALHELAKEVHLLEYPIFLTDIPYHTENAAPVNFEFPLVAVASKLAILPGNLRSDFSQQLIPGAVALCALWQKFLKNNIPSQNPSFYDGLPRLVYPLYTFQSDLFDAIADRNYCYFDMNCAGVTQLKGHLCRLPTGSEPLSIAELLIQKMVKFAVKSICEAYVFSPISSRTLQLMDRDLEDLSKEFSPLFSPYSKNPFQYRVAQSSLRGSEIEVSVTYQLAICLKHIELKEQYLCAV